LPLVNAGWAAACVIRHEPSEGHIAWRTLSAGNANRNGQGSCKGPVMRAETIHSTAAQAPRNCLLTQSLWVLCIALCRRRCHCWHSSWPSSMQIRRSASSFIGQLQLLHLLPARPPADSSVEGAHLAHWDLIVRHLLCTCALSLLPTARVRYKRWTK
jgi:hypothetical protein